MSGILYLVATPIGNLEDITYRAVRILDEVDLIAAEDTRHTLKLLNHLNINKTLTSYYEHNKTSKGEYLINQLLIGKNIALVSDAGTPAISDPGEDLVKRAIENNITVIPVPGACAGIVGLISSGMKTDKFYFEGFLPKGKREKIERLKEIKNYTHTLIFYEAPHKLVNTLSCMQEVFGDRAICLAREMTKKYEEITRTTVYESLEMYKNQEPRGEYVLIVEGELSKESFVQNEINDQIITSKIDQYINIGKEKNESIKLVAKEFGLLRRDVYSIYTKLKK